MSARERIAKPEMVTQAQIVLCRHCGVERTAENSTGACWRAPKTWVTLRPTHRWETLPMVEDGDYQ